jgi:hypothetical protein
MLRQLMARTSDNHELIVAHINRFKSLSRTLAGTPSNASRPIVANVADMYLVCCK